MTAEFDLAIGIIIETEEPLEVISQIMGTSPNWNIKQREAKHKCLPKPDQNIWVLKIWHKDVNDIGKAVQEFGERIPELAQKIRKVKEYGACSIRISIVSEYGQLGFALSHSDMEFLSKLEIPVEVSVFSFGKCVDE